MNDKFFKLSLEKQQKITSAAYRIFAHNRYNTASMSEIAAEAGISKALLFHYFQNKKELYLYLWLKAMELTKASIAQYKTLETHDFFEMLRRSLLSKCALMRDYPDLSRFTLKAYYEADPEIETMIQKHFSQASEASESLVLERMETAGLRQDLDFNAMITEIFYAMDGYMLKKYRSRELDPDQIEHEILDLVHFWETLYTIPVIPR